MRGNAVLDVVLNGRFLSQKLSGVQRVSLEVVRAIDAVLADGAFPAVRVRLAVPAGTDLTPLDLKRIAILPTGGIARGIRGNAWEQLVLPVQARGAALLCLGNTAPLASLALGRRVAVMLHDQAYRLFPADYSRAYRLWHGLLDALTVRRAAPLFTVSEAERAVLTARYPDLAGRICVTPNGGWSGSASDNDGTRPSDFAGYGLYVGALSQRKNMAGIVAVAIALARSRRRRFVFVGPVSAQSEALQAELPADVADLVTFRGHIPDSAMPDLYRGAAYLLYPSFYEASGLPPTEAMAFGCPVVTSDLPVLHERCGDAAIYCDPDDHAEIIAGVERLLDDQALHTALADRGVARAGLFTWRSQALQILDAVQTQAERAATSGRVAVVAASKA